MADTSFLSTISDLSIGVIALLALIVTIRGRNKNDSNDSTLAVQLVALIAGFRDAIEKQTIALNRGSNEQVALLTSQTASIVANTHAVSTITSKLNDDFMPNMLSLFTEQEQKLAAEFRPVVEQLSKVYFSVRGIQEAIDNQQQLGSQMMDAAKAHWDKETATMANLRIQQAGLQASLANMADSIESIFARVMAVPMNTVEVSAVSSVVAVAIEPEAPTPIAEIIKNSDADLSNKVLDQTKPTKE